MNMRKGLILISVSLAFAVSSFAEHHERYTYIGDIPAVCPITIKLVSHSLPESFRIGPDEAVKIASEHTHLVKCNNIFLQQVFIDEENYYIIKSAFGPMNDQMDAVIVNGISGNVSIRKHE